MRILVLVTYAFVSHIVNPNVINYEVIMSVQNESKPIILSPEKVQACEIQLVLAHQMFKPTLTICAQGHEDGVTDIQIKPVDLGAEKPVFEIVGKFTPALGYFPYNVKQTFEVQNADIQEILVKSDSGITSYPVQHLLSGSEHQPKPEVFNNISTEQVVGYAYNQSNLDKAFQDAVSQLYKKHAGSISSKVVESGFVAAGSPVGIAYTYVIMEQA